MKQYTYPAVFYYDDEYNDYAVEFSDICIYAEGDTMEDAYKNAQDYLVAYLDCCTELGVEPNTPNTFAIIENEHPNGKTMLVTVEYDDKKAKYSITKAQETYTNLNNDILEEIDSKQDELVLEEVKKMQLENQKARESAIQNKNDDGDDGDDDFSLPEVE